MNVIEYVEQNMKSFEEEPFNRVDSLVFSELVYGELEHVTEGEGVDPEKTRYTIRDFYKAEYFEKMYHSGITTEHDKLLMTAAAASPRFRDVRVRTVCSDRDTEADKQFAAAIFEIDEETDYVAFRGTDGTMTGWKEDFDLSYMDEVPSQGAAVDFLNEVYGEPHLRMILKSPKKIYLGGHSKGGNLAIYSAAFCQPKIRNRIVRVDSLDGPGFRGEVLEKIDDIFREKEIELLKIVPHSSIIGMLMESQSDYRIVESTATLILQHDGYTWEIEGSDFVYADKLTDSGELIRRTMQEWLPTATDEEREKVVKLAFDILEQNGIHEVKDFKTVDSAKAKEILSSVTGLDAEEMDLVKKLLRELIAAGFRQETQMVKQQLGNTWQDRPTLKTLFSREDQ